MAVVAARSWDSADNATTVHAFEDSHEGGGAPCQNSACHFLAQEAAEFAGYCCRKCRWAHEGGLGGVEHGPHCKRTPWRLPHPGGAHAKTGAGMSAAPTAAAASATGESVAFTSYASAGAAVAAAIAATDAATTATAVTTQEDAASSACHAPRDPPSEAFEGRWRSKEGEQFLVTDGMATGFFGIPQPLASEGEDACSITLGEAVIVGILAEDKGSIFWSNGAMWEREREGTLADQPSSVASKELAEQEEAAEVVEEEPDAWDLAGSDLRWNPDSWEWMTLLELSDRCGGAYGKQELRRYWIECCVEERRWDEDWQAVTWREFRRKHSAAPRGRETPAAALSDLRRRWRMLQWVPDEALSSPDAQTVAEGMYYEGTKEEEEVDRAEEEEEELQLARTAMVPAQRQRSAVSAGEEAILAALKAPNYTGLPGAAQGAEADPLAAMSDWLTSWEGAAAGDGFS